MAMLNHQRIYNMKNDEICGTIAAHFEPDLELRLYQIWENF